MIDERQLAAGPFQAAMAATDRRGDLLAVAMVAQALGTVERGVGPGEPALLATVTSANRRPC